MTAKEKWDIAANVANMMATLAWVVWGTVYHRRLLRVEQVIDAAIRQEQLEYEHRKK